MSEPLLKPQSIDMSRETAKETGKNTFWSGEIRFQVELVELVPQVLRFLAVAQCSGAERRPSSDNRRQPIRRGWHNPSQ